VPSVNRLGPCLFVVVPAYGRPRWHLIVIVLDRALRSSVFSGKQSIVPFRLRSNSQARFPRPPGPKMEPGRPDGQRVRSGTIPALPGSYRRGSVTADRVRHASRPGLAGGNRGARLIDKPRMFNRFGNAREPPIPSGRGKVDREKEESCRIVSVAKDRN